MQPMAQVQPELMAQSAGGKPVETGEAAPGLAVTQQVQSESTVAKFH